MLDVAGRSARVDAVQKPNTLDETLVALCDTPCSVNLPEGRHFLRFTAKDDEHLTSSAIVDVTRGRTLVRHALGYRRPLSPSAGLGGLILGGAGLVGGLVGASMLATPSSSPDARASRAIGGALLGIGLGFVGGAWVLLHLARGETQPGATTIVKLR